MEIYIIRHTTPDVPVDTHYGQSNVALKDVNEINRTISLLPEKIDLVISSPLSRCKQLAEKINSSELKFDERIMELNFGYWELQPYSAIPQKEHHAWMNDFVNYRIPGGESYIDLHARVKHAWDEIIQLNKSSIAIVTHGGAIRALYSIILEMPLHAAFRLPAGYGSVCGVEYYKESWYLKVKYVDRT